jgi:hypothetical protein
VVEYELETESLKIEIRNAKMLGKTIWGDQNRKSRSLLEPWASNPGKKKRKKKRLGHDVNIKINHKLNPNFQL